MKQSEIEAYINGELSKEEQVAFEKAMAKNPELAIEVNTFRQLIEDVELQGVREQVARALEEKPTPPRTRPFLWWWIGSLIFVLAGGLYYYNTQADTQSVLVPNRETKEEASPAPSESEPKDKINTPVEEVLPKQEIKTDNGPIASQETISDLTPPPYPSPSVRGQQEVDENWKNLLDQIWYTNYLPKDYTLSTSLRYADSLLQNRDFTAAYVRLKALEYELPDNDTVRMMKGHCLLEMGQGQEALYYFNELESAHPAWGDYLDWHRSLACLIMKDKEQAIQWMNRVLLEEDHLYNRQAQRALLLIE